MRPIIFLDIDGVFNCQLFYEERKASGKKETDDGDEINYYVNQMCHKRIKWFDELCLELDAEVVISSTWRLGHSIEELREIFKRCGATFNIIDYTPRTGYERGTEIAEWLRNNITMEKHRCKYYDFHKYAIIDDDSDMLLNQKFNFFQTDNYAGLTPTTCYRIKRFITNKTFGSSNTST